MFQPKTINFLCLLAAIIIVLVLPLKKEIWYDETVSILVSNGIYTYTPSTITDGNTTTSSRLVQQNTAGDVFTSTVNDNSNSFLYNIGLHWFILLFGNSLFAYMLFSKLCSVATLIAFFVLCNLFLQRSFFVSVAIILLATDIIFAGMSSEIRAYAMGIFFVTLAAVYLYKFLYVQGKAAYLFFTALFSIGAVLSHFLSVYIILCFLAIILFEKKAALFSLKNMLAILVPTCVLAFFFYSSYAGLQVMSHQNAAIEKDAAKEVFSITEVCIRSMKHIAINFKIVFPSFGNHPIVSILSFILVFALYFFSIKSTTAPAEKRNLHLLFILGISAGVFLALLSIKAHHYTPIYNRYYSFSTPFCSLFITYALFILFKNTKVSNIIKCASLGLLTVPACVLFVLFVIRTHPTTKYNHISIAQQIVRENVTKIEIPEWDDAFLIQCFLPKQYQLNYTLNPASADFTLYKPNAAAEKIPVVRTKI